MKIYQSGPCRSILQCDLLYDFFLIGRSVQKSQLELRLRTGLSGRIYQEDA